MKLSLWIPVSLLILVCSCGGPRLTESEQYYSGRAIATDIMTQAKLHPDDQLQKYVNMIGMTVSLASDRPEIFYGWTFGVIESEKINALAAPSGFILLTTAMIKILKNEDELAAVLAHEIGHINRRHPDDALQAQVDAQSTTSTFGDILSAGSTVASLSTGGKYDKDMAQYMDWANKTFDYVANTLWLDGYTRDQEYRADLDAVDYLVRPELRYNPNALVDALKRMAEMAKKYPAKFGGFHNPKTHPSPEQRVNHLKNYIEGKKYTGKTNPVRTKRFQEMTKSLR